VLQAFINPSGPTREPKKVSLQSSCRFSFLMKIASKPLTQVGAFVCGLQSAWRQ
jgi:hypothetical protein